MSAEPANCHSKFRCAAAQLQSSGYRCFAESTRAAELPRRVRYAHRPLARTYHQGGTPEPPPEANWHDFDFLPAVYETRPNTTRTVRGGDLKQHRGFCGVLGLSCGQGSHPWWHFGAPPHHAHTRARTHTHTHTHTHTRARTRTLHTHAASGRGSHPSVITCPPYTHHTKSETHFRTRTQMCASVTQTRTTPNCPSASSSERAS